MFYGCSFLRESTINKGDFFGGRDGASERGGGRCALHITRRQMQDRNPAGTRAAALTQQEGLLPPQPFATIVHPPPSVVMSQWVCRGVRPSVIQYAPSPAPGFSSSSILQLRTASAWVRPRSEMQVRSDVAVIPATSCIGGSSAEQLVPCKEAGRRGSSGVARRQ